MECQTHLWVFQVARVNSTTISSSSSIRVWGTYGQWDYSLVFPHLEPTASWVWILDFMGLVLDHLEE